MNKNNNDSTTMIPIKPTPLIAKAKRIFRFFKSAFGL
jgi:hypothetical protein